MRDCGRLAVVSALGRAPLMPRTSDVGGVELRPCARLGPLGEVPVRPIDHLDRGAHVAGEVEDREPGVERLGRERVAHVVDPARRDPRRVERRLPLRAAEVLQVDRPTAHAGEDETHVEAARHVVKRGKSTGRERNPTPVTVRGVEA